MEDAEAICTVGKMMDRGVIAQDCSVYWSQACEFLTGRSLKVDFADIKSIKGIKARTPVRFDYHGKSHWVGVENGKIKFNALEHSVCVEKGSPVTARLLTFGEKK